jgi:hypothetical protein
MADDKKPAPSSPELDWIDIVGWFILVFFILTLIERVYRWFASLFGGSFSFSNFDSALAGFSLFGQFPFFTIFLWGLSFILFIACMYFVIQINEVMMRLKSREDPPASEDIKFGKALETKANDKWTEVQQLMRSNSESMWRLAILEADIMLGEMLEVLGYEGQDLGERLKSVNRPEFETIDKAWEAHKVRNKVAHEGSEYELTSEEAHRVIGLYEDVFNEFKFI